LELKLPITVPDDVSTDCLHSIPEVSPDPTFCGFRVYQKKITIDLLELVSLEEAESR
jgi:hypothetical protein